MDDNIFLMFLIFTYMTIAGKIIVEIDEWACANVLAFIC
jgi:hypothetical protein